ncbi:hypothetical protein T484DRAFT_1752565 [Baffinella frigidus]|nr:hypothetical protein T484DRAFT_1752565 [Cryptophyta sp. CCMP2293]
MSVTRRVSEHAPTHSYHVALRPAGGLSNDPQTPLDEYTGASRPQRGVAWTHEQAMWWTLLGQAARAPLRDSGTGPRRRAGQPGERRGSVGRQGERRALPGGVARYGQRGPAPSMMLEVVRAHLGNSGVTRLASQVFSSFKTRGLLQVAQPMSIGGWSLCKPRNRHATPPLDGTNLDAPRPARESGPEVPLQHALFVGTLFVRVRGPPRHVLLLHNADGDRRHPPPSRGPLHHALSFIVVVPVHGAETLPSPGPRSEAPADTPPPVALGPWASRAKQPISSTNNTTTTALVRTTPSKRDTHGETIPCKAPSPFRISKFSLRDLLLHFIHKIGVREF